MAKKAYIVEVSFLTRVVASEDYESEVGFEENFIEAVVSQIQAKINNGETAENVVSIVEDAYCPYDPNCDEETQA